MNSLDVPRGGCDSLEITTPSRDAPALYLVCTTSLYAWLHPFVVRLRHDLSCPVFSSIVSFFFLFIDLPSLTKLPQRYIAQRLENPHCVLNTSINLKLKFDRVKYFSRTEYYESKFLCKSSTLYSNRVSNISLLFSNVVIYHLCNQSTFSDVQEF